MCYIQLLLTHPSNPSNNVNQWISLRPEIIQLRYMDDDSCLFMLIDIQLLWHQRNHMDISLCMYTHVVRFQVFFATFHEFFHFNRTCCLAYENLCIILLQVFLAMRAVVKLSLFPPQHFHSSAFLVDQEDFTIPTIYLNPIYTT